MKYFLWIHYLKRDSTNFLILFLGNVPHQKIHDNLYTSFVKKAEVFLKVTKIAIPYFFKLKSELCRKINYQVFNNYSKFLLKQALFYGQNEVVLEFTSFGM